MKLAAFLCLASCLCSPAAGQEAVVKIHTTGTEGLNRGTGFFISEHGLIVTAYHVVVGARTIDVSNEQQTFGSDVLVDFVSPENDLAILEILHSGTTPYLKLIDYPPTLNDNLIAQGWALGMPNQAVRAQSTRNGFFPSIQMVDLRNNRLFTRNIDIIPLNMTIYPGMSGGPVLYGGQVIGVLSGSYQEGGSIAWAIPCKYLHPSRDNPLRELRQRPDKIAWAPITLLDRSYWRSLRTRVVLNNAAAAYYNQYFDQVEALARANDELYQQAHDTLRTISQFRPFLERIASDPGLGSDPEAVRTLFTEPREAIAESLSRFDGAETSVESTSQQLASATSTLIVWVRDQSGLSDREGWQLVGKMRAIMDEHKDLTQGLASYLNIDVAGVKRSNADLALAMSRAKSPADKARALLTSLDVWQPYIGEFASFRMLTVMSTGTGVARQVGHLLEPIVYQENAVR